MSREERIAAREARRARRAENLAKRSRIATERGTLIQSAPPPEAEITEHSFVRSNGKPLWLNNTYLGAPVFLVLSGPSINSLDLSLLNRRGIVTFGCNNSVSIFRPNLWLAVDPSEKFHHSLWLDPAICKFVHSRAFKDKLRRKLPNGTFDRLRHNDGTEATVRDMPNVVGYRRNSFYTPDTWLSEPTINWGNSKKSAKRNKRDRILNSMLAIIKVCYVLGFCTVYLLGCDFSMDVNQPYAFAQTGWPDKVTSNHNCYRVMNKIFRELRPQFEANNFHVFNCNPNSGLTAFDHLSYEEAIRAATSHIPQILDTAGWYEKTLDSQKEAKE